MITDKKIENLRKVITENLRIQRGGETIDYINIGTALSDVCAKQNHAVFARRGCGKTLLLHHSSRILPEDVVSIYLNCEDFKQHSFPNVLIEILKSLFLEIKINLTGWFGRRRTHRQTIDKIIEKLNTLQVEEDKIDQSIRQSIETSGERSGSVSVDHIGSKGALSLLGSSKKATREGTARTFKIYKEKLQELDRWLPDLKKDIRGFFEISPSVKSIFLQIDDLYHLRRTDQAFVVDYLHRLCKDMPLYFKIATMRHTSTLYADRDGQPIGAQERHDYQSINIDYTFSDFKKARDTNWSILEKFAEKAGISRADLQNLFRGEGFSRLVMAGGGVPRDVLSLFLEVLEQISAGSDQIGKDDIRILSKVNFERRIEELKQDSKREEQDELLRGIYIIRKFCIDKKTNIFVVEEKVLQKNDELRALFYRLLDYRILHSCANAITHKSQEGTYQAFAIDIGCYAHMRKLQGKFNEIDVSHTSAKEKMRSTPVLGEDVFKSIEYEIPSDLEDAIFE